MAEGESGWLPPSKLEGIERRIADVEMRLAHHSFLLKEGMSGGARMELRRLQDELKELRQDLSKEREKTTKWEGGGTMLYVLMTMAGTFIGWVLSHFGNTK